MPSARRGFPGRAAVFKEPWACEVQPCPSIYVLLVHGV